jgi:hypothetical protein
MSRVNIDFVPTIDNVSADKPEISRPINKAIEEVNTAILKLNEILRVLGVAINTIEFGNTTNTENVYCSFLTFQFGIAGVELTAAHGLGRTPVAIIGQKLDRAGDIYFSSAATSANIYLKSDTTSLSGVLILT